MTGTFYMFYDLSHVDQLFFWNKASFDIKLQFMVDNCTVKLFSKENLSLFELSFSLSSNNYTNRYAIPICKHRRLVFIFISFV